MNLPAQNLNRRTLRAHMRASALEFRSAIAPQPEYLSGNFSTHVNRGVAYVKMAKTYRDLSEGKIPA